MLQSLIWTIRIMAATIVWAFPYQAYDGKFNYKDHSLSVASEILKYENSHIYTEERLELELPCITTKIFRTHQWNMGKTYDKVEIEKEFKKIPLIMRIDCHGGTDCTCTTLYINSLWSGKFALTVFLKETPLEQSATPMLTPSMYFRLAGRLFT